MDCWKLVEEPIHDSFSKVSQNFKDLRRPTIEIPHDLVQPLLFTPSDALRLCMKDSIADLEHLDLPSPRVDLIHRFQPCLSKIIARFG